MIARGAHLVLFPPLSRGNVRVRTHRGTYTSNRLKCERTSASLESAVLAPALLAGDAAAGKPAEVSKQGEPRGHASISGIFVFTCIRPEALAALEVKAFDAFPKLKRIDAQVAGAKKQKADRLTPTMRRIAF